MTTTSLRPGPLRHVELLTTASLGDVEGFYRAWGLEVVEEATTGETIAFRGQGPDHHVVRFVRAGHVGLGHIAFAAPSRQVVDDLHSTWAKRGVEIRFEPRLLDSFGGGYGFEATDLEGRAVRVITEMTAADPRPGGQPVPIGITHVVLNTVDIERACAFWTELFGFVVSDWSERQMVFLRNTTDHHTIAFNQAEHASVNHIAYELASLDAFLTSVGRMRHEGVEPLWGLGRHGPGNNCFAYYGDPAGFVPELTADVQQIDDPNWIPRVWRRVPAQSDLWGLAGPPSAEFRSAGAGTPDPNLHPPRMPAA